MAHKGLRLDNQLTGEDLLFLETSSDTGGAYLEVKSIFHYATIEPPGHYHPNQEEIITVLTGVISVRLDGQLRVAAEGDTIYIPKGAKHSVFNAHNQEAVIQWKLIPALNSEYVLENLTILSNKGVTKENGKLGLFCRSRITEKFPGEFRWAKPSWPMQKIAIFLFYPLINVMKGRLK